MVREQDEKDRPEDLPGEAGNRPLDDRVKIEIVREVEGNGDSEAGVATGEERVPEGGGQDPDEELIELEVPGVDRDEPGRGAAAGEGAEAPADGPAADDPQAVIDALTVERDQLKEDLLRRQADFINFRRRMQREKEDFSKRANQALIEELIPVLDNFELAIQNGGQSDMENYRQGVELIHRQLLELLMKYGLEPLESLGGRFDPNFQEAVAVTADPAQESQTVVDELKKGYTLHGKLIRSAMVRVVVNEEDDDGSAGGGDEETAPTGRPENGSSTES